MAVSEAHLNAIPNPLVRMQSLIQRSVSRAQTPTAEIRFCRGWWGDRVQKARDPHRWASKDGKVAQSEPGWSNGSHWSGRVMFMFCCVNNRSCLAVWNCYKMLQVDGWEGSAVGFQFLSVSKEFCQVAPRKEWWRAPVKQQVGQPWPTMPTWIGHQVI